MKDNYILGARASWYQQDDATIPGMKNVRELS
jgi:hypothetical protein